MEDNGINEKQYEIVLSFKKIWDNVKRFWWICAIGFFVALLLVVVTTLRNFENEKKVLEDVVDAIDAEDVNRNPSYIYMARSRVYMARDLVDLNELIQRSAAEQGNIYPQLEDRMDYIELYKEYTAAWLESTYLSLDKTILYDCLALLASDMVMDEINTRLLKNGFEEYDRVSEIVEMSLANNARFFTISLSGDDTERIEFIVNEATNILLEKSKDILGIEKSVLIDVAVAKKYFINADGSRTLAIPRIETEKEEEVNKKYEDAVANAENFKLTIGRFLGTKNLIILIVGLFFGCGIIFIMILLDKKIRSVEELEMYFGFPVIGEINEKGKDAEQYRILMETLEHKCRKEGLTSLLFTGADNGKNTMRLVEQVSGAYTNKEILSHKIDIISGTLSDKDMDEKILETKQKEGIVLLNAPNINHSSLSVHALEMADAVVFMICTNQEEIPKIQKALNHIKNMDGNILGCVLIHRA